MALVDLLRDVSASGDMDVIYVCLRKSEGKDILYAGRWEWLYYQDACRGGGGAWTGTGDV